MDINFSDYAILGLESRDMRVYDALLKLENSSLRTIAATTGLNRGTVYEVIKKLMDLGLVTFHQTGERRRYNAAPPQILTEIIQERRDRLAQLETTTQAYTQSLKKTKSEEQYFTEFYEGDDGIAAILRDVLFSLKQGKNTEYCVISSRDVSAFIYNNFKNFSRQRIKTGFFVRVIGDTISEDRAALSERRQLHQNGEKLNGYVIIYGDKTAIISLSETNTLSAIVIKDAGVTNMQQLIFNQLWESLQAA